MDVCNQRTDIKYKIFFLDKECPLYSQAMSVVMANNLQTPSAPDTMTLVQQMREDGLALKKYI